MQPNGTTRMAAGISAVAGTVIGLVGLILVFGARPASGVAGLGTAMQTIVGGALLVSGALAGLAAVILWLLAARKTRRLR